MSKNNPTIKEVSARVDKLADQFEKGLEAFKNEFLPAKSLATMNTWENNEFLVKLNAFQDSINLSINLLKEDVKNLKDDTVLLSEKLNNFEIRRNYNFIIIQGLKTEIKDLFEDVLHLFNDKMDITVSKNDINQCFYFGKKDTKNGRPRLIAVQFCRLWMRDLVFYKKKILKGSTVMICEMLTSDNLNLFKKARELFHNSAWTYKGLVYVGDANRRKCIRCESDITNF